ncbi:MAG TPA: hypothetical protein VN541_19345 [Tepidisphaeraceae bacterium]|nr:hypothetical protein [Tepidisphaeraceae bacterium]
MLQSLIKFFLGLGLTGALAVTVATTVYNYYQQYGSFGGSGWDMPASIAGVPEIGAGHWMTLAVLLLGGVTLITAGRRAPQPTRSPSTAPDAI